MIDNSGIGGPHPEPIPTEELLSGGAASDNTGQDPAAQSAFLLSGAVQFGPYYAPKRISVTKERELNRQGNFCGGEDVTDLGSKNRELHISGRLLENELIAFESLLDNDRALDLTTPGWGGQIMVKGGEYEGPVGRDARTGEFFFQYSLDIVSTGRDEDDGDDHAEEEATSNPYDTSFTQAQLDALESGQHVGL